MVGTPLFAGKIDTLRSGSQNSYNSNSRSMNLVDYQQTNKFPRRKVIYQWAPGQVGLEAGSPDCQTWALSPTWVFLNMSHLS